MPGGQPPRRPSSVNGGSKAPSSTSLNVRQGKGTKERTGHVLTATAPAKEIRCLPSNLQQRQHLLTANKVVLCFESEYTTQAVWTWLRAFNQPGGIQLSLFNELPNAVFVVEFGGVDWPGTKQKLLSASPLKAGEAYASVNDFSLHLYPCNNPDFRHLVTVNLVQTNQELVGIFEFVTKGIGKFVRASQGTDPRRVSVVVETTVKLFPAFEEFHLEGTDTTKVLFDYRGRNLRCCFCFSYRHLSSQCCQTKPNLFSSSAYTVDTVPKEKPSKGQAKRSAGQSAPREPRARGVAAADIELREIGTRVELQTGGETASKRKRNRLRQRTGQPDTTSELPTSERPSTSRIAEAAAAVFVAVEEDAPNRGNTTSNPVTIPPAGTPAEITHTSCRPIAGGSPPYIGRNLGKVPVVENEENTFLTPISGSPNFVRSGFQSVGGLALTSVNTQTEASLRNQGQLQQVPANSAPARSDLAVALFDGAPRKRLRSDLAATSTPLDFDLNSGREEDLIRPPPPGISDLGKQINNTDPIRLLTFP